MANCPNCHAPLEEGAGFCGVCGTPVPKQVICSHCGQATAADGMFCERCGQPLAPAAQAPAVPEAPVVAAQPVVPAAEIRRRLIRRRRRRQKLPQCPKRRRR